MVYWNEQGGQPRWGTSNPWLESLPKVGKTNDEKLEELGLDAYGNLVNIMAIMLYLVDEGIIESDKYIEFKAQATEVINQLLEEEE